MGEKLLEVKNLTIGFPEENGMHTVVDNVSFTVGRGEIVGIVGESGSGKSMTVQTIMGLKKTDACVSSGEILLNGKDLLKISDEELAKIQGNDMSMVFQEPMTSLNPVKKIGWQVAESLKIHTSLPDTEIHRRVVEILSNVGLPKPEELCDKYPHQLSGGMRQRVMIAMAMICWPKLLICDEPTTALDVTIQAKIIELIRRVQRERGISVIYITHDLGVVAKVADYVNVMYTGKIVEKGTINEIFYDAKHPYTWGLLSAMPDLDTADERLYTIPGSPPNLLNEKQGDAFAPRNRFALEVDEKADPPMFQISETHYAATWLLDPRAPKVEMPKELKERLLRMKKEAGIYDGE